MYILVNDFFIQRIVVDIMDGRGIEIAMRGKRSMLCWEIEWADECQDGGSPRR
jgi:hypothetical protein